ncbi:helix-turn-helix domain-containing protein [Sandaracinobacteroides hominis]|uniref:helix-turn-helix domain-containing protein n=1 Tax=Sandaracinobacteroides hominis TaxID=2780086 RepID=UPI001F2BA791
MAQDLGLSVSYLNLLERNQRPLTAAVLLKLADVYDIDVRQFTSADADRRADDVSQALARSGTAISRGEIREFADQHPDIAAALIRLAESAVTPLADFALPSPLKLIRGHLLDRSNHFRVLDSHAEALADELRHGGHSLDAAIRERLRARHGLNVRVLPWDVMPDQLRRFDFHNRQLLLSEALDGASRTFQLCVQLATLEAKAEIEAEVADAQPRLVAADPFASKLLESNLANYWAAALMMPYGRFHAAAESLGYDLELLQARFSAGFEQVAHRLTTLQRPGLRGIPFMLLRADRAGQISKRFAAGRLPFASEGGQCPLWVLYGAFEQPGKILTQIVEVEGGEKLFTIARTVRPQITPWGAEHPRFAVALACSLDHARALAYAGGLDLQGAPAVPIGHSCTACFRTDCRQRSAPPAGAELTIDQAARGLHPYGFKAPSTGERLQ